jgi:hypothetical protein
LETVRLIEQARDHGSVPAARFPRSEPDQKDVDKIKALRSAKARTPAALNKAIAAALTSVTPEDALGRFASCDYNIN